MQITTGAPELINEIGDLMFQSADFPLADKIAERIKRKIRATTPWLLDDQPGPVIAQLNEQIQKQAEEIAELLQKLAEHKLAVKGHAQQRDVDVYEAHTKRLTAEGNVVRDFKELGIAEQGLEREVQQTLHDMNMDNLTAITEANRNEIDSQVGPEQP